jgi:hypothetical protein
VGERLGTCLTWLVPFYKFENPKTNKTHENEQSKLLNWCNNYQIVAHRVGNVDNGAIAVRYCYNCIGVHLILSSRFSTIVSLSQFFAGI